MKIKILPYFVLALLANGLVAQETPKKESILKAVSISSEEVNEKTQDRVGEGIKAYYESLKQQVKSKATTKEANDTFFESHALAGVISGMPIYYKTNDARVNITANVNKLQEGSITGLPALNGEGIVISVFDGGSISNDHHSLKKDDWDKLILQKEPTTALSSHSTFVGSIIAGQGVAQLDANDNYPGIEMLGVDKGVAPKAHMKSYSFYGDLLQKIYNDDFNVSNHSYGVSYGWNYDTNEVNGTEETGWFLVDEYSGTEDITYFGYYGDSDNILDQIVYNEPNKLVVKSAGNSYGDGPSASYTGKKFFINDSGEWEEFAEGSVVPGINCFRGYDCIPSGTLAKNIIVVGATDLSSEDDFSFNTSIEKANYSSAGPRNDGAIKPDITATGSRILGAVVPSSGYSVTSYTVSNGTSYSAPIVSGVLGLLEQAASTLFGRVLDSDEQKDIILHTAQDLGTTGPDVYYGWGYVDAEAAAKTMVNASNGDIYFKKNTLINDTEEVIYVEADESGVLKATLVWIDPPATPEEGTNSNIVNDLDLRIYNTTNNTVFLPWKLDLSDVLGGAVKGDNTVDNVEQVMIDGATPNSVYKVVVSHKGTLKNDLGADADEQKYTLLINAKEVEDPLSTTELMPEKELSITPNPVTDNFKVSSEKEITLVELYDLSGKLVKNFSQNKNNEFSISELAPSIYVVVVTTKEGEKVTKKIIKN